jgi:hypothetical protein
MPEQVIDMWETGTGLPEEYHGTIKRAWFEFDEDYQKGEILVCKIEVHTTDSELGDNGVVTEMLPLGKGWTVGDKKGSTCKREDGKQKKFNNQSGYGLFIDTFKEAADEDAKSALQARGLPTNADIWLDVEADFKRKSFESTINGEKVSWGRMLFSTEDGHAPVVIEGKQSAAAAAKMTAVAEPPADAAEADEAAAPAADASDGLGGAMKLKLMAAARGVKTYDEFVAAALEIEGLESNEAALAAVSDETPDGIWSQHGGK